MSNETNGGTEGAEWHMYIFFRADGWYPVPALSDADVLRHVELNPGTTRVEDIEGRVVWRMQ